MPESSWVPATNDETQANCFVQICLCWKNNTYCSYWRKNERSRATKRSLVGAVLFHREGEGLFVFQRIPPSLRFSDQTTYVLLNANKTSSFCLHLIHTGFSANCVHETHKTGLNTQMQRVAEKWRCLEVRSQLSERPRTRELNEQKKFRLVLWFYPEFNGCNLTRRILGNSHCAPWRALQHRAVLGA